MKKRLSSIALGWTIPIAAIMVWQWLGTIGYIPKRIMPTPTAVFEAGFQLAKSGELFVYILDSLRRVAIGFTIGGAIGFALGFLNGLISFSEKLTDTSVQMIRTIPHLALIPLVIIWFGIGEQAKIFLVALGVLFPIYLNTLHGIRSVDPGLIEMGKTYGLSWSALLRKIILPGALSSILVGIRFALGIMWLSLIVSETISADSGIGYMAMNAREFMQLDVVVFSILIYALLGKLSDWIAKQMERSWLKWHPHYGRAT